MFNRWTDKNLKWAIILFGAVVIATAICYYLLAFAYKGLIGADVLLIVVFVIVVIITILRFVLHYVWWVPLKENESKRIDRLFEQQRNKPPFEH